MLSMIEVKCPHCGSQGQILLPPLGSIIVGPCPECQGMLCIFSGRILPLDTEIMTQADRNTRKEHLYAVLHDFLHDRVEKLFDSMEEQSHIDGEQDFGDGDVDDLLADEESLRSAGTPMEESSINPFGNIQEAPITVEEIDSFRNVELKLIDNPEYFKAVFRH